MFQALVKTAVAYTAMVAVLRVSGKRTLSKLDAFDLVVTVALGSVLASMALSSEVSLSEGLVVIVVLAGAQYAVTTASVRWSSMRSVIRSEPVLVVDHGQLIDAALATTRLTPDEAFQQAVRSSGIGDLEKVAAAVLETDGSLSVIPTEQCHTRTALQDLPGDRHSSRSATDHE